MQTAAAYAEPVCAMDTTTADAPAWATLDFRHTATAVPDRRSWLPAALLVAGLHALGLSWLAGVQFARAPQDAPPLQISFITRMPVLPPRATDEPVAPARRNRAPTRDLPPAPIDSVVIDDSPSPPRASEQPLRLNLQSDPWANENPSPHPYTLQQRPVDRLPGSNEAIVEGVVLSEELTPEKVVKGIGALLFGARDPDPCGQARQRLADISRQDAASIERDLRRMERYCRP